MIKVGKLVRVPPTSCLMAGSMRDILKMRQVRHSKDETNLLILNSIFENKVYYVKHVDWGGGLS